MLNTKRNDYRRRIKEEKAGAEKDKDTNGEGPSESAMNGSAHAGDEPPLSKKPRLSNGAATDVDDSMVNDVVEDDDDTVDENEEEDSQGEEDDQQEDDNEPGPQENIKGDDTGERHNLEDDDATDSD